MTDLMFSCRVQSKRVEHAFLARLSWSFGLQHLVCLGRRSALKFLNTFIAMALLGVTLSGGVAAANDIYFAQTAAGSGNGNSCQNAYSIADATHGINIAGNWSAGNTLHLCGNITGSTTQIIAAGSGSSGSPITIKWESGAIFGPPYCNVGGGTNACIILSGHNYITLNGGTPCGPGTTCNSDESGGISVDTGVLQNTSNGTRAATITNITCSGGTATVTGPAPFGYIPAVVTNVTITGNSVSNYNGTFAVLTNTDASDQFTFAATCGGTGTGGSAGVYCISGTYCAYSTISVGILAQGSSNIIVENLIARGFYQYRSQVDSFDASHNEDWCINVQGSNIAVHDSTWHDAGWCLVNGYASGDADVSFYNNDVWNIDHGYVLSGPVSSVSSAGPFLFYNNHVHAFQNWDDTANGNHHDGIHCFSGNSSGQAITGGVYWYNNIFSGPVGYGINSYIYDEGSTGPPCLTSASNLYIFNNLMLIANYSTAGHLGIFSGAATVYNNSLVSTDSNSSGTCAALVGSYGGIGKVTFQNNAILGCYILAGYVPGIGFTSAGSNYNAYGYTAGNTSSDFYCSGQTSFSGWKSCIGNSMETNSNAQAVSTMGISTSTGQPTTGSPVIAAGANLTSLCSGNLAALCKDASGNPRPSMGAWDIGAYNYIPPPGSISSSTGIASSSGVQ